MDGFSTVDGFMDVNEGVVDMLKYLANEPSVGLYYVQQHTQNAVPNLLHLNDKVVDRSHETTLHTEDLEDSIIMVRSMKQCGLSIADEMVKEINKSLMIMSTSQPRRGLIRNPSSGFETSKSSSWGPVAFGYGAVGTQQDGDGSASYFSSVLKSAKQRAAGIRWPQLDPNQSSGIIGQKLRFPNPPLSEVAAASTVSTLPVNEAEELPLSSQIVDEQHDGCSPTHELSSVSENYEEFKADREAKLKEWLEEHESLNGGEGK
ncbi:Uncharacterized protein family UPF0402 [Macleaya cordata]|uniref:Uncharacterized protein family UPF0402 n=1 Tax=Macleaya cordata TaxID=56857 RepID=A0A200QG35_MACCD|nr:Uncharacterized protein family UPF0402 [Macleaya cordata]